MAQPEVSSYKYSSQDVICQHSQAEKMIPCPQFGKIEGVCVVVKTGLVMGSDWDFFGGSNRNARKIWAIPNEKSAERASLLVVGS